MPRLIHPSPQRWVISAALVMAVFEPALTMADPIRITGNVSIVPDGSSLSLQGPDFSLSTLNRGDFRQAPIVVVPVGRSVAYEFDDGFSGVGSARVPGFTSDPNRFPDVFVSGRFHYVTPSVFVPDPLGANASFSFPFTMTGTISVFDRFSAAPPLFSASVFGSGTTTVSSLFRVESALGPRYVNGLDFQSFTFSDATPTPEPGTLLLCGSSVVALCLRHRRRQRLAAR